MTELHAEINAGVYGCHKYLLDLQACRIEMTPIQRQQIDTSAEPGAATLAASGVWVRSQSDWSAGSGQSEFDGPASRRDRAEFLSGLAFERQGELRLTGSGALTGTSSGVRNGPNDTQTDVVQVDDLGLQTFEVPVAAAPGARVASKDVALSEETEFTDIKDVCTDSTTLWVLDAGTASLLAYDVETLQRDDSKDIELASGNSNPVACDTLNDPLASLPYIWVLDSSNHVFVYGTSTQTRVSGQEFSYVQGGSPKGIAVFRPLTDAAAVYVYILEDDNDEGHAFRADTRAYASALKFTTTQGLNGNINGAGGLPGATTGMVYVDRDGEVRMARRTDPEDITLKVTSLIANGNAEPGGCATDGTTLWVTDNEDNKVYAYELPPTGATDGVGVDIAAHFGGFGTSVWAYNTSATLLGYSLNVETGALAANTELDITTPQNIEIAGPVTSDGATVWAREAVGGSPKMIAFDITTGSRASAKDMRVIAGFFPEQATYANGRMYLLEEKTSGADLAVFVRVFDTSTRQRILGAEWSATLAGENGVTEAKGIGVIGDTFYVARRARSAAGSNGFIAFDLDGNRVKAKDIPAAVGGTTWRAATAGMVVTDSGLFLAPSGDDDSLALYGLESGQPDPNREVLPIGLTGKAIDTTGNATILWVLEEGAKKLTAYNQSTRVRLPRLDIDLESENATPRGITHVDDRVYVADEGEAKLYAYRTDGSYDSTKDINLTVEGVADDFSQIRGLTSDDTTIWVCSGLGQTLFAFGEFSGARAESLDLDISDVSKPNGCSVNDDFFWISGEDEANLIAYSRRTGVRDEAADFTTLGSAGNGAPTGMFISGAPEIMYVGDEDDGLLYAYLVAGNPSEETTERAVADPVAVDSAIRGGVVEMEGLTLVVSAQGWLTLPVIVEKGGKEAVEFKHAVIFRNEKPVHNPTEVGLTYDGQTLWASQPCTGSTCPGALRRWDIGAFSGGHAIADEVILQGEQDADHIVGFAQNALLGTKHVSGDGVRVLQLDASGKRVLDGIWWLVPPGQALLAGGQSYGNSLVNAGGRVFFGTKSVAPVDDILGSEAGGFVYGMRPDAFGLLTTPVQEVALPPGETLTRVVSDGTVLCLMTSRGVRFCVVGDSGVTVGPLVDVGRFLTKHKTSGEPSSAVFLGGSCYVLYGSELVTFNLANFIEPLAPAWGHVTSLPNTTTAGDPHDRPRLLPVARDGSQGFAVGAALVSKRRDEGALWWLREKPVAKAGTAHAGNVSWGVGVGKRPVSGSLRRAFKNNDAAGDPIGTIELLARGDNEEDAVGVGSDTNLGTSTDFAVSVEFQRKNSDDEVGPVLSSWEFGAVPVPSSEHRVVDCELALIVRVSVTSSDTAAPSAQSALEEYAWVHDLAKRVGSVEVFLGTQCWRKAEVVSAALRPEARDESTGFFQSVIGVQLRLFGDPEVVPERAGFGGFGLG